MKQFISHRMIACFCSILFLCIGMKASAQQESAEKPRHLESSGYDLAAKKESDLLGRKLELTKEQQEAMQEILSKFYKAVVALPQSDSSTRAGSLQSLEKKKEASIKGMLSPQQYKEYITYTDAVKQRIREHRQHHQGDQLRKQ